MKQGGCDEAGERQENKGEAKDASPDHDEVGI